MPRDHLMGYAPAASPDFTGLACDYNVACGWADEPMRAERAQEPRRWVNPSCMTRGDHEAHERDVQSSRLFHVEQGVALCAAGQDVIEGMDQTALEVAWKPQALTQAQMQSPMSHGNLSALEVALRALKEAEEAVRLHPPMSHAAHDADVLHLERLRQNVKHAMHEGTPAPTSRYRQALKEAASKAAFAQAYETMCNMPAIGPV